MRACIVEQRLRRRSCNADATTSGASCSGRVRRAECCAANAWRDDARLGNNIQVNSLLRDVLQICPLIIARVGSCRQLFWSESDDSYAARRLTCMCCSSGLMLARVVFLPLQGGALPMRLKYNNDRRRAIRRPVLRSRSWRVESGLLNLAQLAGVLGAMGWRLSVCPVAVPLIAVPHRLPSTGLAPPRRRELMWGSLTSSRHLSPERAVGLRTWRTGAQER